MKRGIENRVKAGALATFAASALLAGCVGNSGGGGFTERGPTAGVQAVSPNNPGTVAPQGELPPNVLTIPDLPVPPGSEVLLTDTVIVGDDLVWTGQVVMVGDANQPVQVVEFMRRNMPDYGWAETAIVRSRRTSITYVKGERFATVRILPTEIGVEVDVVVAPAGRTASTATVRGGGTVPNGTTQSNGFILTQ